VLVVALGVDEGGIKHILGLWQGATENTTVVRMFLEDLVNRGLDTQRRYLVVIDGAKALRAWNVYSAIGPKCNAARSTSGATSRSTCQRTARKIMTGGSGMPNAMTNYANAKEALLKIVRQLEGINPSLLSPGAQTILLDSLAGAIGA